MSTYSPTQYYALYLVDSSSSASQWGATKWSFRRCTRAIGTCAECIAKEWASTGQLQMCTFPTCQLQTACYVCGQGYHRAMC